MSDIRKEAPVETPAVDKEQIRKEATAAERKRVAEIQKACRTMKLEESFAQDLIEKEVSLDAARAAIIEKAAEKDATIEAQTRTQVRVEAGGQDEVQTRRVAASSAILHRFNSSKFQMNDAGKQYRHMSLMDLARNLIRSGGGNPDFMSKDEIVKRAFSTSDLPNILLDAANKSLGMGYSEAPQTFAPFVRRVSFSDFKTHNRVSLGDAPDLEEVNEGGEVKQGSMSDKKEAYALVTYAKKLAITRQTIINDDLDALGKIPMSWGQRCRQKEADLVYAQITSNPTMGDGVALFHATHSNLQTAAAFAETPLGIMRAAMRKQKSLDNVKIDIRPKFLLVPVALQTSAENVTSNLIVPSSSSGANGWLRSLEVIAEPRLDDSSATAYYLIGDSNQADLIELATLDGQGPKIEAKDGWDVLGTEMRVIYDVAAKAMDHRGLQKNAGV